jgi:hypothetical protein
MSHEFFVIGLQKLSQVIELLNNGIEVSGPDLGTDIHSIVVNNSLYLHYVSLALT